jgi:hypothetical protein
MPARRPGEAEGTITSMQLQVKAVEMQHELLEADILGLTLVPLRSEVQVTQSELAELALLGIVTPGVRFVGRGAGGHPRGSW